MNAHLSIQQLSELAEAADTFATTFDNALIGADLSEIPSRLATPELEQALQELLIRAHNVTRAIAALGGGSR